MADTFGIYVAEEAPTILPDIYPALFDWFFQTDQFQRWYDSESTWQLHCVGGPGAGKVCNVT